MPIAVSEITGLLLAGGQGSRMGHADKGLQPFRGTTMAAHVLDRLRPQVGALLINANRNAEQYARFGAPVFGDTLEGYAGPLAGLAAGLAHCETTYLVSAPCDAPFLPADLVARLAGAIGDADLAAPETPDGQLQPVFCLLKTALLPRLLAYLDGGGRRIDRWFGELDWVRVPFADTAAFANLNTLDELRSLEGPP
jgi:molybdenum cofactor guanylyltransferase